MAWWWWCKQHINKSNSSTKATLAKLESVTAATVLAAHHPNHASCRREVQKVPPATAQGFVALWSDLGEPAMLAMPLQGATWCPTWPLHHRQDSKPYKRSECTLTCSTRICWDTECDTDAIALEYQKHQHLEQEWWQLIQRYCSLGSHPGASSQCFPLLARKCLKK